MKIKDFPGKGIIALLLFLAQPGYAQPSTEPPAVAGGAMAYERLSHAGHPPFPPALAVKSNLLYDLTTTVNLGVEIGLAYRWTLEVPFNYNPWKLGGNTRLRHWGVQPEVRYWFCSRFDGWFAGVHGHYAKVLCLKFG